jgi:Domain of unknown function (DUF4136)
MARFTSAFLVTLVACSSLAHGQDVKTRYMPGTDFSKYRTYCWVRVQGGGYPDQIIDADIMGSIDSQLVAKGLTKADCGTPDSAYAAGVTQPPGPSQLPGPSPLPGLSQPPGLPQPPGVQPTSLTNTANSVQTTSSAPTADLLIAYHVAINRETQWNAFGSGFDRFGPWGLGTGTATATSSTIEVGTLVLNMYDPAAKKLVWAGTATKTISLSKKQEKNHKNLYNAMQKLLKDFPPRQG